MNFNIQQVAVLGMIAVAIAAAALVLGVLLTGHDLGDPRVIEVLGFLGTIITVLLTASGLNTKVAEVHTAINGRMAQLVDATASTSFQAGQTAGVGAPIPPAPSSLIPMPGTGARGPAGPAGPPGPPGPAA